MGDFLTFVILVLAVVVGIPSLIAANLFARTRRLRRDLDELRDRLDRIEIVRTAHSHVAPAIATPPPAVPRADRVPPEGQILPPEGQILPPEGGSYLPQNAGQPAAASAAPEDESLESRIGGRWLLNIGLAAIVISVAYFEKLAIDKRWINETARVIQGGVLGAALIYFGGRFVRKGYAFYGQMMTGGGIAVLYVSIYAAFMFYHLIDRTPAFALMIGVTALGAWLADRHDSQGLAVLAVGGGFLTPFLLRGNTDLQVGLFTYVGIMVGGTLSLARRREWPLLNLISYVFTLLIVAAWADAYYTPAKYLVTELFITLFCTMFVAVAWSTRRTDAAFAGFVSLFLWTAPAAYYVASLAILGDHPMAMLVWVIGVALVAGVLSVVAAEGIDLVVWLAAALPLLAWTGPHATAAWLTPGLATIGAVYAIALAAQLRKAGSGVPPSGVHIAWTHLAALLMFAGAYFMLETTHLALTGPLAAAFGAWQGLLAAFFWPRDRDRAVHFAALAFTLLAMAIALQFDGPAVIVGWAAEGSAVIALGLHVRRDWMRLGGAMLFGVAFVQTLDLLLSVAPANHVVLFNPRAGCALLVIALSYAIAWLHHRAVDVSDRRLVAGGFLMAAQVLSVVWLTREIHAYYALRDGTFTREMMVSVTWAVYATALIVVGLQRRYAPIRYFAIGLFGLTIAKVFFSDLAELDRIYRVMSLMALGVTLLLTSYLYQRMRGTAFGNEHAE